MPDYASLRDEFTLTEYADMSDAEAAAHFNAKTVAVRVPMAPMSAVLQWAGTGPIESIDAGQQFTHTDPATQRSVRAACKAALRLFNGAIPSFDLDSEINRQLLGLFVTVGIVTPAEEAALLAIGDTTVPYYSQPGRWGSPIGAAEVAHARSL